MLQELTVQQLKGLHLRYARLHCTMYILLHGKQLTNTKSCLACAQYVYRMSRYCKDGLQVGIV